MATAGEALFSTETRLEALLALMPQAEALVLAVGGGRQGT